MGRTFANLNSGGTWSIGCFAANSVVMALARGEHRRFLRELPNAGKVQAALLRSILRENADTGYGRRFGFRDIRSVADYRTRVPLTTFDDYAPTVERIGEGEQNRLTRDPVILFEPSSGSVSASKLIPYTKSLKAAFQRAVRVWIYDLYASRRSLRSGPAYWSISPLTGPGQRTPCGIPIGFEADTGYFGMVEHLLFNRLMAVPPEVREISEMETFRYVTLLFLLKAKGLRLISVWHPTFLELILSPLFRYGEWLREDLKNGTLMPPGLPLDSDLAQRLRERLGKDPARAAEVGEALKDDWADRPKLFQNLWPNLSIISCWASANAKRAARRLGERFPHVEIQPKGLVATEGIVTLPLMAAGGHLPAYRSHFFEFIPEDERGEPRMVHELEVGGEYSVLLTNGGGLYRYRLGDLVRVTGFWKGAPLLDFMGKSDRISDHFGEKLNEIHVQRIFDRLRGRNDIGFDFLFLAPDYGDDGDCAYVLFAKPDAASVARFETEGRNICREVEKTLRDNFHYDGCRKIGQIGHLRLFRVDEENPEAAYVEAKRTFGMMKLGDIKPAALDAAADWRGVFKGRFIE